MNVPPIPFDAQRLRRLLAWAESLCEPEPEPDYDDPDYRGWAAVPEPGFPPLAGHRLEVEATLFVTAALALGHPKEIALVERLVERASEWDPWIPDHAATAAQALGVRARIAPRDRVDVMRLSTHARAEVRGAAATRLSPDDPEERARLEVLAVDPDPSVRKAANGVLGQEAPWWAPAFDRDPLFGIEEGAVASTTVAARALVAAVSATGALDAAAAAAALAVLPAGARVAPARRLFDRHLHKEGSGALLVPFLADPDSLAVVIQAQQFTYFASRALGEAWPMLGEEGGPLLVALAQWVVAQPEAVRRGRDSPVAAIADHVGKLWTPDLDASFALDMALETDTFDYKMRDAAPPMACRLLERGSLSGDLLDRAAEALLSGWPAPWNNAAYALSKALRRLPAPRLEALARQALFAPIADDQARRRCCAWGVETLLGEALPEGASALDAARELWEHPEVRAAVMAGAASSGPFLVPLRRALRAGELALEEAACAMSAVGRAFGGHWSMSVPRDYQGVARPLPAHLVPPPELCGPTTTEEWAIWRGLRDDPALDEAIRYKGLEVLPMPPWGPADRTFIDGAVARARAGDEHLRHAAVAILAASMDKADLPLIDELVASEEDPEARARLIRTRAEAWEEAGLRPPPLSGEGTAPKEEEEDDW